MLSIKQQLSDACKNGNAELVRVLLEKVNIGFQMMDTLRTEYGVEELNKIGGKNQILNWNEAIQWACEGGNWDVINSIIYCKNQNITSWCLAFEMVCKKYNQELIHWILEDPQKTKTFNWDWILEAVCESGDISLVNLAIERGGKQWNEGLKGACFSGNLDIIHLMIEHGADNWNAGLRSACLSDRMNIIHLMIEHGANNWKECFDIGCQQGNMNVVSLMLEKEVGDLDWGWGNGFFKCCKIGRLDIAKYIVDRGISKDCLQYGLFGACEGEHKHIIRWILSHNIPAHQIQYAADSHYFKKSNGRSFYLKSTYLLLHCGANHWNYHQCCVPYLLDRCIQPKMHQQIVFSCHRERSMKQKLIMKGVLKHVAHVFIDYAVKCFVLPCISHQEIA